ncbi:TPA: hypothetical protein TUW68_000599 [Streptococcus equi subsp. zooepidemicus]|uniref:tail assembly chaperone n=1 Tax=Streptococcus equi TaxID=1336 RepID=UPI001BB6BA17|nr:tail assembly chaperone [Streptococcus equi]HEK9115249.1 hypothetical protein [Streptococcus equi subsp. equi]MCD3385643.1 tail assembly chaperone [Streptococcus equi subsp. zooepidemicus]MCD3394051.1 tail assembly chaperone [Streptococcus equi subsp. zooepidemicus]QTR96353.1 hypothetical protein HCFMJIKG_01599 [Streptococcus equi subsp. zooepidemicus]HEK9987516.1 hypothetical protein [Streptococcus equi subsp. zooepidemicus]
MEITVGKKTYDLVFGFDFLKYANKHRAIEMDGVGIGAGSMTKIEAGSAFKDPEVLLFILKCATSTENSKPSNEELEKFIEEAIVNGTYIGFYDEVVAEIKKDAVLQQAIAGNRVIEAVTKAK